jgi:hypothetical protein
MKIFFAFLILVILSGCGSFGSNITENQTAKTTGKEKLDASFSESRTVEAPQGSSITVQASGNASVTVTPEPKSMKKDTIETGRDLKSDEWVDQSFSSLYKQSSGLFYLFIAIAALLFVAALKWFGTTCVGRGLGKGIDALTDGLSHVQSALAQADGGTTEHRALSKLNNELLELRRKLEKK